ncbi:Polysaccharide pyruvyl transferase family protein WcaK [Krasilnikoviella flava]|uniref:Polysaccharide pyruvyl transferase family protein WcaK n=1 Tax=Krasilnikoviella flava TaxID=526729 RepID=A0A1T5IEQ7_9MICO|nr:Polysaccharide pyruvyl transferase family protein WcaK [Krasilnikoviella flava]
MRVGLLGQFGYCNFGNEASLDAVLDLLHRHGGPAVRPVVLTDAPDHVRAERGIEAVPASDRSAVRTGWRRVAAKLADIPHAWRVVGGLDAVVVPGTGILEGHAVSPFGPPFQIALYGVVARVRRRPYLVLSVGADRRGGRAHRLMQRTVARTATYLSARDAGSADALAAGARRPPEVPDLVLGLPLPEPGDGPGPGDRPLVAVGVVRYDWYAPADERDDYADRTARLTRELVRGGVDVVLVVGDGADDSTAQDVAARIDAPDHVHVAAVGSVAELERRLVGCRAMVAVRYHNLVGAIRTRVPVVSLGYGPKQRWLLERFGDPGRAHDVRRFDPQVVARQVLAAVADADADGVRTARALAAAQATLAVQERRVAALLGLAGPVAPALDAEVLDAEDLDVGAAPLAEVTE